MNIFRKEKRRELDGITYPWCGRRHMALDDFSYCCLYHRIKYERELNGKKNS